MRSLKAVLFLLVAGPAALSAQKRGSECELNPGATRTGQMSIFNQGTPQQVAYFSGRTEFRCSGGVTIIADSIMAFTATQTRYFIGNVSYSDADKTMTAGIMTSYGNEGRVSAQNNVIFTDRKNGSVIKGQNLEYYEAGTVGANGPDSKTLVYGGQPHAVIREKASADSSAVVVDADQMDIRGERYFKGTTNVVVVRGEIKGTGAEVEFDRATDLLKLTGNAHVDGPKYSLTAGTITGTLKGDRLENVAGEHSGVLLAEDLRVEAPSIKIGFDTAGLVQNMIAVNAKRSGQTEGAAIARAVAQDFELTADSIHALTPGQKIESVTAVGQAYGVRSDSVKSTVPEVASKDWLRGDTIRAFFVDVPPRVLASQPAGSPAPPDSVGRELDRVIALGGATEAQSTYRVVNERNPNAPPGLNYLAAREITVQFRDGEVQAVEAKGKTRGIHLEPNAPKPAPAPAPGTGQTPAPAPPQGAAVRSR